MISLQAPCVVFKVEGVCSIQIEQNNKTVQYNKNKYKKQPENVGGLRATKTFINDKLP